MGRILPFFGRGIEEDRLEAPTSVVVVVYVYCFPLLYFRGQWLRVFLNLGLQKKLRVSDATSDRAQIQTVFDTAPHFERLPDYLFDADCLYKQKDCWICHVTRSKKYLKE